MNIDGQSESDSHMPDQTQHVGVPTDAAGLHPSSHSSSHLSSQLITSIPIHARGLALTILATVAFVFALQWARLFFIPLVFSVLISYTLAPVVCWLERLKIPRVIAVCLILLTILSGALVAANSLRTEFQSILARLPESVHQISKEIVKSQDGQPTTMQQMQAAATEIERASAQASNSALSTGKNVQTVVVARPAFQVQDWLLASSLGGVGSIGQATMVAFLVFFFLMSGDRFKRKLVKISGPSLSSKKVTLHILYAIDKSIQSYMFMQLVTSLLLAVLLWVAFRLVGLDNAGAWAVAAGCLRIIPYIGSMLITIATALAAYVQFESMGKLFLVSGMSLAIAVLVGIFLTTWMTGRYAKMNAVAVFIGLLFWGWLWGIWGLLLGIPIIVAVRVISEHVDGLHVVAEMLGE